MAKLSASVPPLVKIISDGEQFKSLAMVRRDCSNADFVFLPKACEDEGLPKYSVRKGIMACATSGRTGVVAALSRYTFIEIKAKGHCLRLSNFRKKTT
jgi:hypothetical protein